MGALRGAEWIVEKEASLRPITPMARSTEKNPFRIEATLDLVQNIARQPDPAPLQALLRK